MKSTKQIADILGVSKMTVYRFIKSNNERLPDYKVFLKISLFQLVIHKLTNNLVILFVSIP